MPIRPVFMTRLALMALCVPALADQIKVVAAENFYGDVATQIGGANVAVTSILTNPDVDPHLFQASTETARALADAKMTISNGVADDLWRDRLLKANPTPGRKEIVVGELVGRRAGDNPQSGTIPLT